MNKLEYRHSQVGLPVWRFLCRLAGYALLAITGVFGGTSTSPNRRGAGGGSKCRKPVPVLGVAVYRCDAADTRLLFANCREEVSSRKFSNLDRICQMAYFGRLIVPSHPLAIDGDFICSKQSNWHGQKVFYLRHLGEREVGM